MQFIQLNGLKNVLPICSHCKRVRSPKGPWFPIELPNLPYLHVALSHGICPDCARKYYPAYFMPKA
jgi:hypothetical protein